MRPEVKGSPCEFGRVTLAEKVRNPSGTEGEGKDGSVWIQVYHYNKTNIWYILFLIMASWCKRIIISFCLIICLW